MGVDIAKSTGWAGLVLIHSSTIPTLITKTQLPPLSMVLLLWIGLFLFLINAYLTNNRLYLISNAIGFVFQSIMLALIIL